MTNDKKAVGKLLSNIDLDLTNETNAELRMQVDVIKSSNSILYDILKKIPLRMRAEKLRQLAAIGAIEERKIVN